MKLLLKTETSPSGQVLSVYVQDLEPDGTCRLVPLDYESVSFVHHAGETRILLDIVGADVEIQGDLDTYVFPNMVLEHEGEIQILNFPTVSEVKHAGRYQVIKDE